MTSSAINRLCDTVRETSFAIHPYHRHGHVEKIYENALVNRLRKQGLDVKQQHPLAVYDKDGTLPGDFAADLCVEGCLIVELKASAPSRMRTWRRSGRIETGLLINFGASSL